jgi:hypothetical protein
MSQSLSSPEPVNSLWIGEALGPVERACLASFLRNGHAFTLWCYDPPKGVPPGVRLRDAAEILPRDRIIRHRGGSPALFANHFRYRLQRLGLGIWVDCDLYLLRPLLDMPEHLFAWESEDRINNALIRFPPSSPLIPPLLEIFDESSVPPWLPPRARLAARWRLLAKGRSGVEVMPWGSAGPLALTWLARRFDLDSAALPAAFFYPMPWQRADWIRDPRLSLEDVAAPETLAIHLWNERIRSFKDDPAPAGSFLARLQSEGA